MTSNQHRRRKARVPRQGVAIIMVIAFYAVAIALIGVWVRSALDHQQQARRWHEKTQVNWLAEAGVRRAVAIISNDKNYTGERWLIESAEIGGDHAAEIVIRVESVEGTRNARQIIATAHYPPGQQKRVQSTKTLEFSLPTITELSGESS